MLLLVVPSDAVASPPLFVELASHPVRWQLLTALAVSDYRVRELVAHCGQPQNLVSYHLGLLRRGGLVTATRSSYDGRDSYYRLEVDRCADGLAQTAGALHPCLTQYEASRRVAHRRRRSRPAVVLFVCTGNSVRSPMAEALLRQRCPDGVTVISAGTRPKPQLHPDAVRVLRDEFGIDAAGQQPRHLGAVSRRRFDHVITLCDKAKEACPPFVGSPRRSHWSIPDPASVRGDGAPGYLAFRRVAEAIDARVRHLVPVLIPTADQGA